MEMHFRLFQVSIISRIFAHNFPEIQTPFFTENIDVNGIQLKLIYI